MTQNTTATPTLFTNLGIAPKLLAQLELNKFTTPTPIQAQVIPTALTGKDVVGIAQTGTGKTLAFGIPLIQRLAQHQGQGLIMLPTRELAIQVEEALQKIGRGIGLKTAVLIGGGSMFRQVSALRAKPHVIIATPGRLFDHLEQKNVSLTHVKVVVLDEADRMFDIGFAPQIKKILALVPRERQTMLFSATMPSAIALLATHYMHQPVRIEVAPAGTSAKNVVQEVFMVSAQNRMQLLEKILTDSDGSVLLFSRTKRGAHRITMSLRDMGQTAAELHADRSQAQRQAALEGFKKGNFRILVATDIAARGIDVQEISLVINYDLPDNSEDYVHRIGRTGRAGHVGKAISFAGPDERGSLRDIEKLIRKTLPILALPVLPPPRARKITSHTAPQPGFRGQKRGGRPAFRDRKKRW